MKIVADENMPLVPELFGGLGEVVRLPGRQMRAVDVKDADVLLVRSVTRVDRELLAGSRVRFVGTATIGTDHLDLGWLAEAGIAVASAPGCNARAVAEYVATALLELALEQGFAPAERRVGVVGLGNVGSQVAGMLSSLGFPVRGCDPFRPGVLPVQQGWRELLADCDILALHTPLTRNGTHPTLHMVNEAVLATLKPGSILLNAGRGAVVDNRALRHCLEQGQALTAVLDVWEGEPSPDPALLARARYATPHVAGYSQDGKWRGSGMVQEALYHFLGKQPSSYWQDHVPADAGTVIRVPDALPALPAVAWAMRQACPLARDDAAFRAVQQETDPAAGFDRLRKHYPVRREFPAYRVAMAASHPAAGMLARLGFRLCHEDGALET